MRSIAILFLFVTGSLSAQTTFKSLQQYKGQENLVFRMNDFAASDLTPSKIKLPDVKALNQQNYQSDVKLFAPQQYNLVNYPSGDASDMDDLLMGTSLSNTLEIGKSKVQTTYFFDVGGNLQGSQTSFSFGNKK